MPFELMLFGGEQMKIHREKLKIAMARACMSTEELQKAAEMPRPTINNAISNGSATRRFVLRQFDQQIVF